MMNFFRTIIGTLFGGGANTTKTLDIIHDTAKGVGTWIDERNMTEEERSKANLETLQVVLRAVEATRDENSTRSVTRRYLAWSIMGCYLLTFLLVITLGYQYGEYGEFLIKAVTAFGLDTLALGVGSFYFLVSVTRALKRNRE